MRDFRITSAKVLLKVHSIAPIRNFNPPSFVVVGDKLDRTEEIVYNGVTVEEFVISDSSRLIVRVPRSQIGRAFESLRVLTSVPIAGQSAAISMELSRPPKMVSGIDRLVQVFLTIFYSTPGSDIWDKRSGAGGYSLIGRTTDRNHNGIAADLALAIERTREEITRIQAANPRIPPDERLLSCTLDALDFDEQTSTTSAQVSITNMVGEAGQLSVR